MRESIAKISDLSVEPKALTMITDIFAESYGQDGKVEEEAIMFFLHKTLERLGMQSQAVVKDLDEMIIS